MCLPITCKFLEKTKIAEGLGIGGKIHLNAIQNFNSLELEVFVAPLNSTNLQVANKYDVTCYESLEDCLQAKHIDGVIIASPNDCHVHQALTCRKLNSVYN